MAVSPQRKMLKTLMDMRQLHVWDQRQATCNLCLVLRLVLLKQQRNNMFMLSRL
uniref:Uncharacterized protein n=1 Tax=Arundo donax TaxID=35708 RepID=A0A0A9BSX8_ARUDO